MGCCVYHSLIEEGCESAFTIDPPTITFGWGCLDEAGPRARRLDMRRIALFTDARVRELEHVEVVRQSLQSAGLEVVVFGECLVEPTSASFASASRFLTEGKFDGIVSVGGGSVMDTAKAANLYATHPTGDFLDYVNAPVGGGQPVPGPLMPHIACPTTSGTGSEGTGIAIFDLVGEGIKTGIASARLRPTEALVDPNTTFTLPTNVVACSAFDVLCHALESFTARPYVRREKPDDPTTRPGSQGANPWSDMGCREALRLLGGNLVRGVRDPDDRDARSELMWASTLAGIAFGNSGVHAPHGMSYAVAGQVRDYQAADYPSHKPMVPHGMSVVLTAPSVFRSTAESSPGRHLEAARLLGAAHDVAEDESGELLGARLEELMRECDMPNGLEAIGYRADDVEALVEGAFAQQRLLVNAPVEMDRARLAELFAASMRYW